MHQGDIGAKDPGTLETHSTPASHGLLEHPSAEHRETTWLTSASEAATLSGCLLHRVSQEPLTCACISFSHPARASPVYSVWSTATCTSLGSSHPSRASPALSTLGYPGLHPNQLQLSCQVTLSVESPRTTPAGTHFSFSCPAKVPSGHRTPGRPGLIHFSFSCLDRVPAVWKSPGPPVHSSHSPSQAAKVTKHTQST